MPGISVTSGAMTGPSWNCPEVLMAASRVYKTSWLLSPNEWVKALIFLFFVFDARRPSRQRDHAL